MGAEAFERLPGWRSREAMTGETEYQPYAWGPPSTFPWKKVRPLEPEDDEYEEIKEARTRAMRGSVTWVAVH